MTTCSMPAVLLLAHATLVMALGDDVDGSGFHQSIRRIKEARDGVKSYDVTITGEVKITLERQLLSDGTVYDPDKVIIGFTTNIVYDRNRSKLLVTRQETQLVKATGEKSATRWKIFGRSLHDIGKGVSWTAERGRFIGAATEFFDPLALGLCFEGEFRRGDPWERVIANYSTWPDGFQVENSADGKVQYSDAEFSIVIDTERGQWPVRMARLRNNNVQLMTEIRTTHCHGQWLPEDATVMLPDRITKLHFQWHSVNEPIPESRFMREDIQGRYGSVVP